MDLSGYLHHARRQHASRPASMDIAEEPKSSVALSRPAVRLLVAIDPSRRLRTVPASYPHILNRLADLWGVPESVERYLETLLLTGRTGRRGFPPAVVIELTDLREKNRRRLTPGPKDVWQEALLR